MFPGAGSTFQEQALATTTHVTRQAFTQSQNPNFMPRIGFAYTPFNDRLTLIHGGVGLYENAPTPFQIASNLPTQPPNRISLSENTILPYEDYTTPGAPYGYNYPDTPVYGTAPWGNTYSNPEQTEVYSANLNGFVPELKPEKIVNFSLGIDRQFAKNMVFGISYVGSYGYDLLFGSAASGGGGNVDYNLCPNCTARPTDHWGQINYGRNGLRSNFNQMVVTLKQNAGDFSYQANYNWSRALQTAPIFSTDSSGSKYYWNNPEDPKQYSGPSPYDVPNSFSLAGAYQVPRVFQRRLANAAASGWRLSTIIIAQSGTPFTAHIPTVDYQNDGGFAGSSGTTRASQPTTGPDVAAFRGRLGAYYRSVHSVAVQQSNRDGYRGCRTYAGGNSFRNFGYFNVDAGLAKSFSCAAPSHVDRRPTRPSWRGCQPAEPYQLSAYGRRHHQRHHLRQGDVCQSTALPAARWSFRVLNQFRSPARCTDSRRDPLPTTSFSFGVYISKRTRFVPRREFRQRATDL